MSVPESMPWEVGQSFQIGVWQVLGNFQGRKVNVGMIDGETTAKFIAKAPEMYKILKEILEATESFSNEMNYPLYSRVRTFIDDIEKTKDAK
jgi:hypothetical protein